jgi:hydroxymethylbilane synthase
MNEKLEGGCQVPIAAFAQIEGNRLRLDGLVGSCDGKTIVRTRAEGAVDDPAAVGVRAADDLIAQGAREILRAVYESS